MREWCSLDGLPGLTRQRILDANDLLDARDEAEEDAQAETENSRRKK